MLCVFRTTQQARRQVIAVAAARILLFFLHLAPPGSRALSFVAPVLNASRRPSDSFAGHVGPLRNAVRFGSERYSSEGFICETVYTIPVD
jgi:hypothetical protein